MLLLGCNQRAPAAASAPNYPAGECQQGKFNYQSLSHTHLVTGHRAQQPHTLKLLHPCLPTSTLSAKKSVRPVTALPSATPEPGTASKSSRNALLSLHLALWGTEELNEKCQQFFQSFNVGRRNSCQSDLAAPVHSGSNSSITYTLLGVRFRGSPMQFCW